MVNEREAGQEQHPAWCRGWYAGQEELKAVVRMFIAGSLTDDEAFFSLYQAVQSYWVDRNFFPPEYLHEPHYRTCLRLAEEDVRIAVEFLTDAYVRGASGPKQRQEIFRQTLAKYGRVERSP